MTRFPIWQRYRRLRKEMRGMTKAEREIFALAVRLNGLGIEPQAIARPDEIMSAE